MLAVMPVQYITFNNVQWFCTRQILLELPSHTLQNFTIKWSFEHELTSTMPVASTLHIHFTVDRFRSGYSPVRKLPGSNLISLPADSEIQVWTFRGVWAALAPRVLHATYSFKVTLLKQNANESKFAIPKPSYFRLLGLALPMVIRG